MKSKLCLILLLSALLASCQLEERRYTMDEGMLTALQSDGALTVGYRIPVHFLSMSDEYLDYLQQQALQEDPFSPTIKALYVDTITGANISLTDMRMLPAEKTEQRLKNYKKELNPRGVWEEVALERFKMNGYPQVAHVHLQNETSACDRYYFYDEYKAVMSFDFVYPASMQEAYRPYFESTLASIRKQYEFSITAE